MFQMKNSRLKILKILKFTSMNLGKSKTGKSSNLFSLKPLYEN